MTAVCIHPRHGDDPPATDVGMLCRGCYRRLSRDISDTVGLWPLLDAMLLPGNAASGGARGKPGSRPPCNLDVADITDPRGAVSQQLTSWAAVVIEDRRLAPRRLDGHQAARLLAIHADWLAEQPFADEVCQEIHDVAHAVRRACRDLPDPPIGTCPDIDPMGQRDTCGGPLRIDTAHQWGAQTVITVVCGRCGSAWADADLPHILRIVQPTRRFPVPRAWVVARYRINPGQLRTWIWRKQVRTYSDGQVELFDVLARLTDTPNRRQ